MTRNIIIGMIASIIAIATMACVEFDRLEIETQSASETEEGIIVEVRVTNTGEAQDITTVASGLYGIDSAGKAWAAVDECSTLDGMTVAEGRPVTGTVCFPFRKADDEGVILDYVPSGTQIMYLMATDNIFVGDTDIFHIHPVTISAPSEPDVATDSGGTAVVEVRVWEDTSDASKNYISARAEGGSWQTLGTIPLPLDSETGSGRFRYGDITLSVPLD